MSELGHGKSGQEAIVEAYTSLPPRAQSDFPNTEQRLLLRSLLGYAAGRALARLCAVSLDADNSRALNGSSDRTEPWFNLAAVCGERPQSGSQPTALEEMLKGMPHGTVEAVPWIRLLKLLVIASSGAHTPRQGAPTTQLEVVPLTDVLLTDAIQVPDPGIPADERDFSGFAS